MSDDEVDLRDKLAEARDVLLFRPVQMFTLVVLSVLVAVFEGIGLTLILPLINEVLPRNVGSDESNVFVRGFETAYGAIGVPLTLETVLAGVALVMILRYVGSFAITWIREVIRSHYIRDLRARAFDNLLGARVGYFDERPSDEIINAIITQTEEGAQVIYSLGRLVETGLVTLMYFSLMLVLEPVMTLIATALVVAVGVIIHWDIESGHAIGNQLADANEEMQEVVQTGAQGIREIKAFEMEATSRERFSEAIADYVEARIKKRRNLAAIRNFQLLIVTLGTLIIIYVALTVLDLSIGVVTLLLFTMVRLGPKISTLNNIVYDVDNFLAHQLRTKEFIDSLADVAEPAAGSRPVPDEISRIEFDDVDFTYGGEGGPVLNGVSFTIEGGSRVAFVGPSGAGKSTIVSLLTGFYTPDDGEITVNDVPIREFERDAWRRRVSLVRQTPYIFNGSLGFNLTLGEDVPDREVESACEIARVDEFLDELDAGFDTFLGDEGARISGGQKQRIAIARALIDLTDGDILVLDEATSEVDNELAAEIHEGIRSLDADVTVVMIAHRLSTVDDADRIFTVENGTISEAGGHDELVDSDGVYASLYE